MVAEEEKAKGIQKSKRKKEAKTMRGLRLGIIQVRESGCDDAMADSHVKMELLGRCPCPSRNAETQPQPVRKSDVTAG